jgi:hypothetical protein
MLFRIYGKFILQIVAVAFSSLVAALVDDTIDNVEWVLVLIAVGQAVAVLGAGTFPSGVWRYTKTIVAAALAGLALLVAFVADAGVSTTEWLQVAIAAIGAAGIPFLKGPVTTPAGIIDQHGRKVA